MSTKALEKKHHPPAAKKRHILAAQRDVKRRVHKAEMRGLRRGRRIGTNSERTTFANLGLFSRIKAAFTGSYVQE